MDGELGREAMNTRDCKRVHGVWLTEDLGRDLPSQDSRGVAGLVSNATAEPFLLDHLDRCPECRLEWHSMEVAARRAQDPSCSPAPQLNDLARRRFLDTAVFKAQAEMADHAWTGKRVSAVRSWWKYHLAAGLAAAAILFFVFLLSISDDSGSGIPPEKARDGLTASPMEAKIVLVSNRAPTSSVEGKRWRQGEGLSGDSLSRGEMQSVGDGNIVVSVETGISVIFGPQTRYRFKELKESLIDIELKEGTLFADLRRDGRGPPFAVTTAFGRVVVTGTAFRVTADRRGGVVEVFRGSVRLEGDGNPPREIGFGQSATMGEPRITDMDKVQMALAGHSFRLIDRIAPEAGATMEILSSPKGAEVYLDDDKLGRTPLWARVRTGNHSMKLVLDGYESVAELVTFNKDEKCSRKFLLSEDIPLVGEAKRLRGKTASLPSRTPEQILQLARSYRKQGLWKKAAREYGALIQLYPERAEARSALVSLGFIQLEHMRRPDLALSSYNLYLKRAPQGPLAPEAYFGRAMAYRAMGRNKREKEALREFLGRFPGSFQADRAGKRLQELSD